MKPAIAGMLPSTDSHDRYPRGIASATAPATAALSTAGGTLTMAERLILEEIKDLKDRVAVNERGEQENRAYLTGVTDSIARLREEMDERFVEMGDMIRRNTNGAGTIDNGDSSAYHGGSFQ